MIGETVVCSFQGHYSNFRKKSRSCYQLTFARKSVPAHLELSIFSQGSDPDKNDKNYRNVV